MAGTRISDGTPTSLSGSEKVPMGNGAGKTITTTQSIADLARISTLNGLGAGIGTFLTTPSSANLAAAVTDETGSGALVFGTAPTITLVNGTGLPLTTGITGILSPLNGGAGVSNNSAATVTSSGNFAFTRTLTGTTNVTFPTSGTLASLAGTETFSNHTFSDGLQSREADATATNRGFNISARDVSIAYPAASFRPSTANKVMAFDIMPNGASVIEDANGWAWMDICSSDVLTSNVPALNTARVGVKSTLVEFGSKAFNGASDIPVRIVMTGTSLLHFTTTGASIFGGGTALIASEYQQIRKDQNAATVTYLINATSGTAAYSGQAISSSSTVATALLIRDYSAGFTTSGMNIASSAQITSTETAGLNIGTSVSAQFGTWTNNVRRSSLDGSGNFNTGSTASAVFRTTNAGSDVTAHYFIDPASSLTAGLAYGFETTNGLVFTQGNATRRIAFAGIKGTNLTSTAGSEAGGLGFFVQTGGTALAQVVTINPNGRTFFGGSTSATALVHLAAGTATASTSPLKFTAPAALLTVPEALVIEPAVNGDYLNLTTTTGTVRRVIVAGSSGRAAAQTALNNSVATYTLGATDATYEVSANVLVTTSSAENFTVTVSYTDEGNTARVLTLNFQTIGGTLGTAVNFSNGAVPYEGVITHLRCKASTSITVKTTGTFTGCTYNVEGIIKQTN